MKYIAVKNFINGKQKRVKRGDEVNEGDQYDQPTIKKYIANGMVVSEADYKKLQKAKAEFAEKQKEANAPSDEKQLKNELIAKEAEIKQSQKRISELEAKLESLEKADADAKKVGGDQDKSAGPSENK